MATIDQAVLDQAAARPGASLAVIVTVDPALGDDQLAAAGLAAAHRVARINAVSGTIQAADLDRLAGLAGVVRIEADAPMRNF